ncbi:22057_t:CDS:2, partial [Racocetra persica]
MRHINQGKLIVLQDGVFEISENPDFLYIYMSNSQKNIFRSPYIADKVTFENNEAQGVSNMIRKLASKHKIPIKPNYYLINYITGECTCLDFIWHGSFHNFCKHDYAVRIYMSIKTQKISIDQIKKEFVQYFRNKERIVISNIKNQIIYSRTDEEAYIEILYQYKANGSEMFFLIKKQITENNLFRPNELPKQRHSTAGLSKINSTKPRELKDQIIVENEVQNNTINDNNPNFDNFEESSILQPIFEQSTGNNKSRSRSPLVSVKENVNMPYSVELCQTKRTRNNKRKAALGGYVSKFATT